MKQHNSTVLDFAANGTLSQFTCKGKNLLAFPQPALFTIQFRDFVGNPFQLTGKHFDHVDILDGDDAVELTFTECAAVHGTSVKVTVSASGNETRWRLSVVRGRTDFPIEWIEFPQIRFARRMDTDYILPGCEGVLLKDLKDRDNPAYFQPKRSEYPLSGVNNFYPGPVAMQFEACCHPDGSLYFACLDEHHYPKTIDFMQDGPDAFIPLLQHFTGGEDAIAYDTVIEFYDGNWETAAEKYRSWMTAHDPCLPPPQKETMPEWLADSPVILMYPVKGHGRDHGGLDPNEYYPYPRALPMISQFQKKLDSRIMSLLMHWEGTAPWAPPYIWPPSGGEAMLGDFINAMHQSRNLVGLYASGIGWTQKSMIDPAYDRTSDFTENHVEREICKGPRGEAYARVCNSIGGQRIGYELCPARTFTVNTVCGEVRSAASLGVDYLQYFDQNQGCTSPLCYAKDHGHPEMPGTWQAEAMRNLLNKAQDAAGNTVLGCENAAAEPYMHVCRLNDLRSHLAWGCGGMPIPLYSYVFHEYVSGFTGNGVCLGSWIDYEKTPFYMQWNIAWNFSAGNVLAVVLKDGGKIFWNWGKLWDSTEPPQAPLLELIRNLNAWRKGRAARYLVSGRMEASPQCLCRSRKIYRKPLPAFDVPAVMCTSWSADGKRAVLLVNYSETPELCCVTLPAAMSWTLVKPDGTESHLPSEARLDVPPLNALLIEAD